MADEEDEFGVGEEGALGDGVAEEEGRGASDSAGEDAGDGVRGSMGGDADGCVAQRSRTLTEATGPSNLEET